MAAIVPLILLGIVLVPGSGPASAAATPLGCESVFFLGAVGSGEWADNKSASNPDGQSNTFFGKRVGPVLKGLKAALPTRGIASISLPYPAKSVSVLSPSSAQKVAAATVVTGTPFGPAWAVADYRATNLPLFMGSISVGVDVGFSFLYARASRCPAERIVLAGYSQGAMVMHRLINKLHDTGENTILARIAGVVLMADGDRVPNTLTSLSGAPVAGPGGEGVASWGPGASRDIASTLIARTFSICSKNDIVCDFRGAWTIKNYSAASKVHTGAGYINNSTVLEATKQVASMVRGWAAPTPPALNASAVVGKPFRLQLVADARPGSVLRWRPTTLPAGLSLSSTGLISGTPRSIGTWRVGYQVQASPTGPFSDWIPGTVTLHTSAVPADGSPAVRVVPLHPALDAYTLATGPNNAVWGLLGQSAVNTDLATGNVSATPLPTSPYCEDTPQIAATSDGALWSLGCHVLWRQPQASNPANTWAQVAELGYEYSPVASPDNSVWLSGSLRVLRVTSGGQVTRFDPPDPATHQDWLTGVQVAVAPDGAAWGVASYRDSDFNLYQVIAQYNVDGSRAYYDFPFNSDVGLQEVLSRPDGSFWWKGSKLADGSGQAGIFYKDGTFGSMTQTSVSPPLGAVNESAVDGAGRLWTVIDYAAAVGGSELARIDATLQVQRWKITDLTNGAMPIFLRMATTSDGRIVAQANSGESWVVIS